MEIMSQMGGCSTVCVVQVSIFILPDQLFGNGYLFLLFMSKNIQSLQACAENPRSCPQRLGSTGRMFLIIFMFLSPEQCVLSFLLPSLRLVTPSSFAVSFLLCHDKHTLHSAHCYDCCALVWFHSIVLQHLFPNNIVNRAHA